jgi:glycine dehydrogenase subunit 1
VVVQTPNIFGTATDLTKIAEATQAAGALLIVVVTEVVSLGLLKSPGEMGADIVAVEGQSIGVPLSYGGPYVGLFAAKEKYLRQMPGRLCGETVDADGERGFVLTLSTREQHIRRDKATSNICTNSGLCALAFSIHMSLLGQEGLRRVAKINYAKAHALMGQLRGLAGVEVVTPRFFNEFTVKLTKPAAEVVEALAAKGILGGVPVSRLDADPAFANHLILAATETVSDADMTALVGALKEVL